MHPCLVADRFPPLPIPRFHEDKFHEDKFREDTTIMKDPDCSQNYDK
ncbi:hypothetical protein B188_09730 [Candidatus Brocadiaceae bacterium B188]|nr:hypothetical protein B188_09730 [Candidatus Brocadiaceae bacterium B188]